MSLVDSLLENHCFTTLEDNFGVVVALQRRSTPPTINVSATWEQVVYNAIDNEGMTTTIDARSYLFEKTNYVIGGKVVEPQRGDRILEPIGNRLVAFEIAPIAGQAAVIEMPGGYRWKVHVERVKETEQA